MNLLVTGTPGSGKTTLAKGLAKKLKMKTINEKDFALKNAIGNYNEENELELPTKILQKKANLFLKKNKGIIFEGHVFSEIKLAVDKVILLTIDPEELEMRLELRKYSPQKLMDNVFCEGIEYCKKHVLRNYPQNKIIEIKSKQTAQLTLAAALSAMQK